MPVTIRTRKKRQLSL